MIPGLDVLPIALSGEQPPKRVRALIRDADRISQDFAEERGTGRIPELVTSDGLVAWSFLEAAAAHLQTDTPRFCEWGSGVGSVTCMAHCRGWDATGIEIEPRLVAAARGLAAAHDIDVTFHECSYKPPGLFDEESAAADFDTGLGFSLFDFDVIYGYLWPAELRAVTKAIAQHARNGTIFLRYSGGVTCDAFRVNRPGVKTA